mmetsp:Transcript_59720/g.94996  ORF Transcript_59720/g.94996 Transcript_59720/m.94996 type:complete len:137 (-) Transcript_59720:164-574(-)|eukprot:CAMPEP_0197075388 /NCGR_PEP_ID=MMETSP1384-20130603/211585_1 /TAXON_ID=29189 /ORGANISM="Ammonia sp." /LENGTH=136 /DNA_ID=CAMNT_0042514233 /DNA_START=51 /DNA_END=461 /DNA_ORIENTATION=-
MIGNDDFMPQIQPDVKELLIFRAWSGSGWVRPMFYFSIATIFVFCILAMIYVGYSNDGAFIFFAVVAILIFCLGSILYNRILFEMLMGILQIPRLIIAVDKLESAMRNNYERKAAKVGVGVRVLDDEESNVSETMQ